HHNARSIFSDESSRNTPLKNLLAILKMAEHICGCYRVLGQQDIDHEWESLSALVLDYVGLTEYQFDNLKEIVLEMGVGQYCPTLESAGSTRRCRHLRASRCSPSCLMPELPEVETTRRGIEPFLTGQRVRRVLVRERRLRWPIPEDLDVRLSGQRIERVERRAKYLLIGAECGTLIAHLGMSGSLRLVEADTPVLKHEHVDIELEDRKSLV